MDDASAQEFATGLEEGFRALRRETVVPRVLCVLSDGTEIPLRPLQWDTQATADEGLAIDQAGVRVQCERILIFLKSELNDEGITLDGTQWFQIDGERWDFSEGAQIADNIVPLGDVHNLVMIQVRKAVELNQSRAGADFTYEPA